MTDELFKYASAGGKARALKLTKEQRSEIARRAVEVRWEKAGRAPLRRATHTGDLRIGNNEIPCAVLDDGTRLLTQQGFLVAVGRAAKAKAGTGSAKLVDGLPPFLAADSLKPFINKDLRESTKPIDFRTAKGVRAYGYDARLLPMVCTVYLEARQAGVLRQNQLRIAQACEILMRGLAHVGIIALVDEATGFQADRARDALAEILERFVAKELQGWVRRFQADFYQEMFRLRKLPFDGTCKRPQYMGKLTDNLVYRRLAPGVLEELRKKNPRNEKGRRKAKHHQWLTDEVGHPKLEQHLAAVTALMRASDTWDQFKAMLDRSLPKHPKMDLWEAAGINPDD